jgi:hypothetical protein
MLKSGIDPSILLSINVGGPGRTHALIGNSLYIRTGEMRVVYQWDLRFLGGVPKTLGEKHDG